MPIRAGLFASQREQAAARLGIVAGNGDLPRRIVEACRELGREVFVVALEGEAQPGSFVDLPHVWCRLGAAGAMLEALRSNDVSEIVLAGGVRRPSLSSLRPDWRAAKLFARIGYRALGDDGLLSAVVREIEREGFRVVGADQIVSALLMPPGRLGIFTPDAQALSDIAHARRIALAIGRLDIGQAVVVQQGIVLGVEAVEGTDELLRRCARLRRNGPGGVLVKMEKPQQERRVDRPTIGLDTLREAAAAGLRGVAAQAGATILLDRQGVIAAADAAGLFLFGIEAGDG